MRKRIEDGQLHTWYAKLREHTAVNELDERVNDALRMDNYLDPIVRQPEQEMGFDHLERLVRERGTVDGDFAAHAPGWMAQRVLDRRARELIGRPFAKRTTRGSDDGPADIDARSPGEA